jgi:hypothetical protein
MEQEILVIALKVMMQRICEIRTKKKTLCLRRHKGARTPSRSKRFAKRMKARPLRRTNYLKTGTDNHSELKIKQSTL